MAPTSTTAPAQANKRKASNFTMLVRIADPLQSEPQSNHNRLLLKSLALLRCFSVDFTQPCDGESMHARRTSTMGSLELMASRSFKVFCTRTAPRLSLHLTAAVAPNLLTYHVN